MADKKISQLQAATLPLAGTELLPIVQSGTTDNITVNNLAVGNIKSNATTGVLQVVGPAAGATRVMTTPDANFTVARIDAANSFTADQTLSTGNLVIGTSGKGIDFSATPGTGTSELLADYEEGTWTVASTNLTIVGTPTYTGTYTKIGNVVYVNLRIQSTTSTSSVAGTTFINLGFPFLSKNIYTTCPVVNTGTNADLGLGIIGLSGGNTIIYLPTWTGLADVTLTGFYYT